LIPLLIVLAMLLAYLVWTWIEETRKGASRVWWRSP
jgi:hypothetical protein